MPPSRPAFRLGLEVALEDPPEALRHARFGLLCNQASLDAGFRCAHALLGARFPGHLRALFTPQHGLFGEEQDNMIESPHGRDPETGIPVHSLYAATRKPSAEQLKGLDLLVVDLQDVGTRVYTYVWTLMLCLEACAAAGVEVLVLDRPNPIGGRLVEGPPLSPALRSFVGLHPVPMRHGLTLGEAARHINRSAGLGARLHVVPMQGWRRDLLWGDLGRTWVPTSPNLPRHEGALVYPGQVLLEGTNVSEGRGTTTPFEVCGAPWVDPHRLLRELEPVLDDALVVRPYRFRPTFHKFHGESCGGLYLHPREPHAVRSYRFSLGLLAALRRLWPEHFAWRPPPYEYEAVHAPIDILTGDPGVRSAVDAGAAPAEVARLGAADAKAWWSAVAEDLLYPA
ncbi:MAG: DUF1343 domain-containing protein [Planctomycetes bacterium]|nr:DUF1343 domain-containing protein [Planctomycetota bacterium]